VEVTGQRRKSCAVHQEADACRALTLWNEAMVATGCRVTLPTFGRGW
jgi:hypothetical protein